MTHARDDVAVPARAAVPAGAVATSGPHTVAFRLTGRVDIHELRSAVRTVAHEHGVLPHTRDTTLLFDSRHDPDLDEQIDRLTTTLCHNGNPIPLQVRLTSANAHDHLLTFLFHPLAANTVSAATIVRAVARRYRGEPEEPTPGLENGTTTLIPPTLPLDRPRPSARDLTAVTAPITLSVQQLHAVATYCSRHGSSIVDERDVALALFAAVLYRYDGGDAICLATLMTRHDSAEHIAPATVRFSPKSTFAEIVGRTRNALAEMPRSPRRTAREIPVFACRPPLEFALPAVRSTIVPTPIRSTTEDLAVYLTNDATGTVVMAADVFTRDTAVRFAGHLRRLLAGAAADPTCPVADLPLLTEEEETAFAAVDGEELATTRPFPAESFPTESLPTESSPTESSPTESLPTGSFPAESFPAESFPVVFQRQAARTPEAVAVRAENGTLTYGELDRASNRLAHLLRASGVGPEVAVGLCLDRGSGLAVSVLAVLKAGGAYVPLDPRDPQERRADMVTDSAVRIVLSEQSLDLPGVAVLDLNAVGDALAAQPDGHPPDSGPEPSQAAYILYTSGSTGKPKGVVVEHRHLMSYVVGLLARLGVDRPLRFAMVQPLTVDSSVTAFFPPLCTGGQVHLLSRERVLDAAQLAAWTTTHGVDVLKIAPSHLRALQSSPSFGDLLPSELLIVGGEAADWRWLRDLQAAVPACRVHNHYGPTETTVGVLTLAVAEHVDAEWDIAPIGRPLPGVRIDVVDAAGQPVPVGVVGELVVRGRTVARGYHNRPELTDAAFGTDRTHYRTGDHVRRLADGTVAFVGRHDDQVKIRGFRVEPGEITAALCDHPSVRAAVTVVREDQPGDRAVVSYVEPAARSLPQTAELLAYLRSRVAPHMVPRAVVVLDRFPLSSHGKVDRTALPLPPLTPYVPQTMPGTELERVVADVWQQVLHVAAVGADVNFFDIGGHSLLLVDLQQRLRIALRREVDLLDLLAHTTVRAQARLLSAIGKTSEPVADRARTAQQAALLRHRVKRRRAGRGHDV